MGAYLLFLSIAKIRQLKFVACGAHREIRGWRMLYARYDDERCHPVRPKKCKQCTVHPANTSLFFDH